MRGWLKAALEALEILYPARLAEVPVSTPLLDGLDGRVSTMHVNSAHVHRVQEEAQLRPARMPKTLCGVSVD